MSETESLKFGIEVDTSSMFPTELISVIILLEELKKRHPVIYPIAAKAVEEAGGTR